MLSLLVELFDANNKTFCALGTDAVLEGLSRY